MNAAKAIWTKMKNGEWGLRVDGGAAAGATVTVTRKDGSTSTEKIVKVLWSGVASDGRQASLVTIEQRAKRQPLGYGHGHAKPMVGYSSYCTANGFCRCYDCAS